MDENSYMLSIIVPVYNVEKYLQRCLDSLIKQSCDNIEIILVDDGSTDSSPSICDEYAYNDNRVIVIHKKNEGQGLARNDGIQIAKGKYICFLDSDDYYEINTSEKLFSVMEKTNADICSYGYQIDDKNGNMIRKPKMTDHLYEGKNEIRRFVLHYFGDSMEDDTLRGVSSCMSVFKRKIIFDNDIHFPSERVVSSEDTAFCLEYCKHINKAVTISDSLYHYCQNEGSFSQGYREDRFKLIKAHIDLLNRYAEMYENYDSVKDRIAMTTWINVLACYKQVHRHFGFGNAVKQYKTIIEDEVIQLSLANLPYRELPLKQRLLYELVKRHIYWGVYFFVGIRVRKRL